MKNANHIIAALGLGTLVAALVPADAAAYGYRECAFGGPIKWKGSKIQYHHNTCSIPKNSPSYGAMQNGLVRWNAVGAMADMFVFAGEVGACTWQKGNGVNEILLVNPNQLNVLTTTVVGRTSILEGIDCTIDEIDVRVANTLPFGHPAADTSLLVSQGYSVFLHEFGHALGLSHAQLFNHMRAAQPTPFVGGPIAFGSTDSHVVPMPDDAEGGRFLYPTFTSQWNIFATTQRRLPPTGTGILANAGIGDSIVDDNSNSATLCKSLGGPITVFATGGNNGTVSITHNKRWHLGPAGSSTYNGGTTVGTWSNSTYSPNKNYTQQVTMSVPPGLAAGVYSLFYTVDATNTTNETHEYDNFVRTTFIVNIVGGC